MKKQLRDEWKQFEKEEREKRQEKDDVDFEIKEIMRERNYSVRHRAKRKITGQTRLS